METLCSFRYGSQEGARSWRALKATLRSWDLIVQVMGHQGGMSAEAETLT